MEKGKNISIYISYLLRHHPEKVGLKMDKHGWVCVEQLIDRINQSKEYKIDIEKLKEIVKNDNKGRYRFNQDMSKIKACQGHSISWVEPELQYLKPPVYLYHGTTTVALEKIMKSGKISKMSRHAVHLQADIDKAWQSAMRWKLTPVILKIAAMDLYHNGGIFGKTENDVWCIEDIPVKYIVEKIYEENNNG